MTIISFAVGIVSIVLAIVAIFSAKLAEKGSQDNFEKTQAVMREIYDKTKEALAEIDKKAEIIDSVVQRNQEKLIETMTNILNETVIPKKPDIGEELGAQFIASLMNDPSSATEKMKTLMNFAGEFEKYSKK